MAIVLGLSLNYGCCLEFFSPAVGFSYLARGQERSENILPTTENFSSHRVSGAGKVFFHMDVQLVHHLSEEMRRERMRNPTRSCIARFLFLP